MLLVAKFWIQNISEGFNEPEKNIDNELTWDWVHHKFRAQKTPENKPRFEVFRKLSLCAVILTSWCFLNGQFSSFIRILLPNDMKFAYIISKSSPTYLDYA